MDIRTGKTYATRDEVLKDGVPESDIAETIRADRTIPEVRFANGPLKNRTYKRTPHGQLVRVK